MLRRRSGRLSNLRLFTFVFFLGLGILLVEKFSTLTGIGAIAVGLGVFTLLVIRHEKTVAAINDTENLLSINRAGLARIDGGWKTFSDTGEEFLDPDHVYAKDLDIFGRGSLFQWLNATGTFRGRRALAEVLSNTRFSKSDALANRGAIEALAGMLDWRQNFACRSLGSAPHRQDPGPIVRWMQDGVFIFSSAAERLFFRLLPLYAPLIALLVFLTTGIPHGFVLWVPINAALLMIRRKPAVRIVSRFERHEPAIRIFANLLSSIERQEFSSELLMEKRACLFTSGKPGASRAIARLGSLVAFSQGRYGMMGPVFNLLFFLDIQSALSLETWKRVHGRRVESWIDAIAAVEMLSSLATVRHDNPDWCFAHISDEDCSFSARGAGHPLIDGAQRVCNDVELDGSGSVVMITGSNMSGKTTLLRTIGINLVLTYAGAPACASALRCGAQGLLTSMRITDDLQNGISTFYAELLRIRTILDSLRRAPSIVLIDEIFRGTNTHDRHQAARSVLTHLATQRAISVISTHDLDLAELETKDAAHFKNFHFEDTYKDGSIHFDYLLRPGRATSSNALHLLEMVGIIPK
jgi:hypothetical protein